jgi:hypothetical protein
MPLPNVKDRCLSWIWGRDAAPRYITDSIEELHLLYKYVEAKRQINW